VSCYSRATLEEVMVQAIAAQTHRVWIINASQNPIGVVTFSDILQTLLP